MQMLHLLRLLTNSILIVLLLKSLCERKAFSIALIQIANLLVYNFVFSFLFFARK